MLHNIRAMERHKFNITGRNTPKQILSDREMSGSFLAAPAVAQLQIYEVQLLREDGGIGVSLMTNKECFDKIANDTFVIVEESGWWNQLCDKTVKVLSAAGEQLTAIDLFSRYK